MDLSYVKKAKLLQQKTLNKLLSAARNIFFMFISA